MKNNIIVFVLILALPFALSSQTRKAIPAGRYEALSGIKMSHSGKSQETGSPGHETSKQVWGDIEKYFSSESNEILYANLASAEVGIKSKNFHEASNMYLGFDLLITSDLQKDKMLIKFLRGKKMIALFDVRPLDKVMPIIKSYELVSYRAEKGSNFYLLKTK
jgi:hypothetical protein